MPSLVATIFRLSLGLVWLASLSDAFSLHRSQLPFSNGNVVREHNNDADTPTVDYTYANRQVSLPPDRWGLPNPAAQCLGAAILAASLSFPFWMSAAPLPAHAESPRIVGQLQGSGLVFKDTLQIESFDDPKVQGVTLYISNFQRPITERLTSNFLQDPSYASVACAKTGPVRIADNIATGTGGEEVFEESRSLLFKTLRVRRIYDADKKTVVYVSYNTRLDKSDDTNKSRFKSSLCAVSLE